MNQTKNIVPDHTAVRVALWRAMHVQVDAAPHVFTDEIGLQLAAPDVTWRQRPDMHPEGTRGYRASIVGRARLVEDLLEEKINSGIEQYVILGAGLDTFAQRRGDLASRVDIFEVDRPETQRWKQGRLEVLGFGFPRRLHFVPVDFEAGESWRAKLSEKAFESSRPAFIASTGVSMYLSREANRATLAEIATMASGTTVVMTFMLPLELIPMAERAQHEMVYERARAAGTPFLSFFRPEEILSLAREVGFQKVRHVSGLEVRERYFSGRPDALAPSSGEEFLVATTG